MSAGMVPSIVFAIKTRKTTEYLISTIVLGLFIYIDSCAKTKIFKK